MSQSVAKLKFLNSRLEEECVVAPDGGRAVLNNVYVVKAAADKPWCAPYARRETEFCRMIRDHQTHRVHELRMKGKIREE